MMITAGSITALVGASSLYFLRRRISRNWIDMRSTPPMDLNNQVIVITGGNVGLGYETAKDLALRKARVVLGCRDVTKGQEAVTKIQEATGNDTVECLELDLASLASVRTFCSNIKSKYPPLHALVLNAGVWYPMDEHKKTSDGFEIHFGVNHLAHVEMARLLTDHMSKEPGTRIVFVSSTLSKMGKIDFETQDFVVDGRQPSEDEKKSFAPTGYCDSKLMNAITCRYMASTFLPPHVQTYAVCPGFCRSSLARNVNFGLVKKIMIAPIMLMVQRTTVQGAQNIIFTTVGDSLVNGGFYRDGEIAKEVTEHADSLGSDAPEKLWKLSEKLAAEH